MVSTNLPGYAFAEQSILCGKNPSSTITSGLDTVIFSGGSMRKEANTSINQRLCLEYLTLFS